MALVSENNTIHSKEKRIMLYCRVFVIDVGINKISGDQLIQLLELDPSLLPQYEKNKSEEKDYVLAGDVNVSSVKDLASALTPVPGGVGPLTIAMLMKNTVLAARMRRGMA